jgi:hypothetical protein
MVGALIGYGQICGLGLGGRISYWCYFTIYSIIVLLIGVSLLFISLYFHSIFDVGRASQERGRLKTNLGYICLSYLYYP